jgi:hypothetical protein
MMGICEKCADLDAFASYDKILETRGPSDSLITSRFLKQNSCMSKNAAYQRCLQIVFQFVGVNGTTR